LVFKVTGSIQNFANAVKRIPGLELIDEEELASYDKDKSPVAYLLIPDERALKRLLSLWNRWRRGQLVRGETPWGDLFKCLKELRPWGPGDRVSPVDRQIIGAGISKLSDTDLTQLEIELVFRKKEQATLYEIELNQKINEMGGNVISRAYIEDIAYHALLIEFPVSSVRDIVKLNPKSLAELDLIMHIRPQSLATGVDVSDVAESTLEIRDRALGSPILAILDGVPVAAHPWLGKHLIVDDQFDLESEALVDGRKHGTAMASLVVHGDLNKKETILPRKIHFVPVLGKDDSFTSKALIIDMIYLAIKRMREGADATAPDILIVNLSLGDRNRQFYGSMSPWARLLDRLAHKFGILFIVSAGNITEPFPIDGFNNWTAYEDAQEIDRRTKTLNAIAETMADRRVLSPAETVNGITVGAANIDNVSPAERRTAKPVNPYPEIVISNPSSALGPGFAKSVKPDIIMPGAREHLRMISSGPPVEAAPAAAARAFGLKVAAPPSGGIDNSHGYTGATSAAAALASRTCHRIHDALEEAYGDDFVGLSHIEKALILKALLAHPAKWPEEAAALITSVFGQKHHTHKKDDVRRFIGYGLVDSDEAVACAADRATFWATGVLEKEASVPIRVPIPAVIGGKAQPHELSATLAWFTPTAPGRKSYRTVRLNLLNPSGIGQFGIAAHSDQPDANQSKKGTIITRRWTGRKAANISSDTYIDLIVQREPDQGIIEDDKIVFAMAATITMPGVVEIYDRVRAMLGIATKEDVKSQVR
jgi:hypothetical protein